MNVVGMKGPRRQCHSPEAVAVALMLAAALEITAATEVASSQYSYRCFRKRDLTSQLTLAKKVQCSHREFYVELTEVRAESVAVTVATKALALLTSEAEGVHCEGRLERDSVAVIKKRKR